MTNILSKPRWRLILISRTVWRWKCPNKRDAIFINAGHTNSPNFSHRRLVTRICVSVNKIRVYLQRGNHFKFISKILLILHPKFLPDIARGIFEETRAFMFYGFPYPTMHHFITEMCTFLLENGALRLMHWLWAVGFVEWHYRFKIYMYIYIYKYTFPSLQLVKSLVQLYSRSWSSFV